MFVRLIAVTFSAIGFVLVDGRTECHGQNSIPLDEAPSFRTEVMAVLSKSGCNLGTCHGNQHGKGGLKLSLRGQDPDADFATLTRQLGGRRTSILNPEQSLLLQKPAMIIPHEGGRRFDASSRAYQLLRNWIASGLPDDSTSSPQLTALRVTPDRNTVVGADRLSAVQALAEFADGSSRDVTQLAVFESSNPAVQVSSQGEVEFAESNTAQLTTITVRYLNMQATSRWEHVPHRPGFVFKAPEPAGEIDRLVFANLERLQINPSPVCDDTTFVRRVFLDLTGQLPTSEKAQEFLASTSADKRAKLIDELLASPEFVDTQTLRWADLLRVEDKTLDPKGVQVFHQWIRDSIAADKPLNEFTAEIMSARGSTYVEGPANFFRALRTPEERSESVAQVFLGIRLQCAKCHNHPFDRWTQDDYYGWTNYFARLEYKIIENHRRDENDKHEFDGEQIVFMKSDGNVRNPTTGQRVGLRFLGDSTASSSDVARHEDRLLQLADWFRDPNNDRFAATQANRIWFQLIGRGIVDPIDDFRATNPPVSPELLDHVTQMFVTGGYRVRPLMREILNSRTYQLASSSSANTTEEELFAHAVPRRLTAEQTLDAVASVLDVTVRFGGHPQGTRASQLAGVRNGGHRFSRPEAGDRFLAMFGKPSRLQTCECERTADTSLAQTMELVGGELISDLLRQDDNLIAHAVSSDQTTREFVSDLYWSALTRAPSPDEADRFDDYVQRAADRQTALRDIVWAVLNSNEFLLRR